MNINIPKISFNVANTGFQRAKYNYSQQPVFKANNQQKDTFEMSVGYVNDLHGQTNNMMRILSGVKGADKTKCRSGGR